MTDFLLELRSEEIPARMQDKAKEDLARLFGEALGKAGLKAESVEAFATPRRLALMAKGLPLETEATSEETKGPKVGAPPQAMEGFLRKTGLTLDQLVERDGVYFAVVEKAGQKTADVLAEAIPAIIRAFPWPKSQRWGAASITTESLRWVRPLQGIVALLGDDVVACEVEGITSGRETMGHRFHSSGPVNIANAAAYVEALRAAHVIVHFSERCAIIREGAAKAAADAGLVLVEDDGLVAENAGLTEWPVPMLGRFDPAFLDVPEEVIQLTARVNQKYFVCKNPPRSRGGGGVADGGGAGTAADVSGNSVEADTPLHRSAVPLPVNGEDFKLANAFVCTANIVAKDGGAAIVAGNEKVLAARLSDAKFFWEQDLKVPLDEQAKKLEKIVFHEKLGSVADKVERVAKLAEWLVTEDIVKGCSAADARRAAELCKADLVTGMVGEFPELQGIMGGYYARAQGEPDAVADAVRDHYKPVGQGDDVPTAPVTVAVSLADKLDTIASFFSVQEMPTGSRDPFALRRAAIGAISTIKENSLRLDLVMTVMQAVGEAVLRRYMDPGNSAFVEAIKAVGKALDFRTGPPVMDALMEASKAKGMDREAQMKGFLRLVETMADVRDFFLDRLEVSERTNGTGADIIRAAQITDGDRAKEADLVRLLARVKALQGFITTDEGVNLLAGYKRAANILKQSSSPLVGEDEGGGRAASAAQKTLSDEEYSAADAAGPHPNPSPQGGGTLKEQALLTALNDAEPTAQTAIEAEDFEAAMAALASLRAPIDAFFEGAMVNDPDPEKRAFRLGLLARFRDAVHKVADFSRIEG